MPKIQDETGKIEPKVYVQNPDGEFLKKILSTINGAEHLDEKFLEARLEELKERAKTELDPKSLSNEKNNTLMGDLEMLVMATTLRTIFMDEFDHGLNRDILYNNEMTHRVKMKTRAGVAGTISRKLEEDGDEAEIKEKYYVLFAIIIDIERLRKADLVDKDNANAILNKVAAIILNNVGSITVPEEFSNLTINAARWGGDEFLIMLDAFVKPEERAKFSEIMKKIMIGDNSKDLDRLGKQDEPRNVSILSMLRADVQTIKGEFRQDDGSVVVESVALKDHIQIIEIPEDPEKIEIWKTFINRGMLLDAKEMEQVQTWILRNPTEYEKIKRPIYDNKRSNEEIQKLSKETYKKYPQMRQMLVAAEKLDQILQHRLNLENPDSFYIRKYVLELFYTKIVNPLVGEYLLPKRKFEEYREQNQYNEVIGFDFPLKEVNKMSYVEGDLLIFNIANQILNVIPDDERHLIDIIGGEGPFFAVAIKRVGEIDPDIAKKLSEEQKKLGISDLDLKTQVSPETLEKLRAINMQGTTNKNIVIPIGVADYKYPERKNTDSETTVVESQTVYQVKDKAARNTYLKMAVEILGDNLTVEAFDKWLETRKASRLPLGFNNELSREDATMEDFYVEYFIQSARAESRIEDMKKVLVS